jgi:hypothetical protein
MMIEKRVNYLHNIESANCSLGRNYFVLFEEEQVDCQTDSELSRLSGINYEYEEIRIGGKNKFYTEIKMEEKANKQRKKRIDMKPFFN